MTSRAADSAIGYERILNQIITSWEKGDLLQRLMLIGFLMAPAIVAAGKKWKSIIEFMSWIRSIMKSSTSIQNTNIVSPDGFIETTEYIKVKDEFLKGIRRKGRNRYLIIKGPERSGKGKIMEEIVRCKDSTSVFRDGYYVIDLLNSKNCPALEFVGLLEYFDKAKSRDAISYANEPGAIIKITKMIRECIGSRKIIVGVANISSFNFDEREISAILSISSCFTVVTAHTSVGMRGNEVIVSSQLSKKDAKKILIWFIPQIETDRHLEFLVSKLERHPRELFAVARLMREYKCDCISAIEMISDNHGQDNRENEAVLLTLKSLYERIDPDTKIILFALAICSRTGVTLEALQYIVNNSSINYKKSIGHLCQMALTAWDIPNGKIVFTDNLYRIILTTNDSFHISQIDMLKARHSEFFGYDILVQIDSKWDRCNLNDRPLNNLQISELTKNHENVMLAQDYALNAKTIQPEKAIRITLGLFLHWSLNCGENRLLGWLKAALAIAEGSNEDWRNDYCAHLKKRIGDECMRRQEYSDAKSFYEAALVLYTINNDLHGIAHVYKSLGDMYFYSQCHRKNTYEMRQFYIMAIRIFRNINNESGIHNTLKALGDAYKSIGDNYKLLDPPKTLRFYRKSIANYDLLEERLSAKDDYVAIAFLLRSKGKLFKDQNDIPKAIRSFQSAINVLPECNNRILGAEIYKDLGDTYSHIKKRKELHKAIKCYCIAIKTYHFGSWQKEHLSYAWKSLGEALIDLGASRYAKTAFRRAIPGIESKRNWYDCIEIYCQLAILSENSIESSKYTNRAMTVLYRLMPAGQENRTELEAKIRNTNNQLSVKYGRSYVSPELPSKPEEKLPHSRNNDADVKSAKPRFVFQILQNANVSIKRLELCVKSEFNNSISSAALRLHLINLEDFYLETESFMNH